MTAYNSDYGFHLIASSQSKDQSPHPSTSQSPSQSAITLSPTQEGTYQSETSDVKLFGVLCPGTQVLTGNVVTNKLFVLCIQSARWDHVMQTLLCLKEHSSMKSPLQSHLSPIDASISSALTQIKDVARVKIMPSLGLDVLTQSCFQKRNLLMNLGQYLLSLKLDINASGILNNLHQRI